MPMMNTMAASLGSPDEPPIERARRVGKRLSAYVPPKFMDKPELGLTDEDLLKLYEKWRSDRPLSPSDKASLRLFSNWRASVMLGESQSAGVLDLLLTVTQTLEAEGKRNLGRIVREHIEKHWWKRPPEVLTWGVIRSLSEKWSFRMDVLPRYLRTMDIIDAPAGMSITKTRRGKRKAVEELDEAIYEQGANA